jgi:hypothetical protein
VTSATTSFRRVCETSRKPLLFALAHDQEATETLRHCCFAGDAIDGQRSVQPFQTLASGDLRKEVGGSGRFRFPRVASLGAAWARCLVPPRSRTAATRSVLQSTGVGSRSTDRSLTPDGVTRPARNWWPHSAPSSDVAEACDVAEIAAKEASPRRRRHHSRASGGAQHSPGAGDSV